MIGLIILSGLFLFSLLLGIIIINLPNINGIEVGSYYLGFLGAPDSISLFKEALQRRFANAGGWLTLTILLSATTAILLRFFPNMKQNSNNSQKKINIHRSDTFVILMILLGTIMLLGVEFVYLRDQFGWRINTIFKFYYQTWLLWSIAAAYGLVIFFRSLKSIASLIMGACLIIVILMSLFYPLMSLPNKTNGFSPTNGWTLDGTAFLEDRSPDEMEAIQWLRSAPLGVVAEAISPTGGSYQWPPGYARVSALTGYPTVLGWTGHESQWRGGSVEMGTRQPDIMQLYCSMDVNETNQILEKYNIRYVFIGELERATYRPDGDKCPRGILDVKFDNTMVLVFQNEAVKIYETPGSELLFSYEE